MSTYTDKLAAVSRTPCQLCVITLDSCSLAYGVGACTASGAAADSCYNTYYTCQDVDNYTRTTTDYDFVTHEAPVPFETGERPYIKSIDYMPTEIQTDKTVKGRVVLTMVDEPDSDVGIDPYVTSRTSVQGNFWKKLLARNTNYKGRPLKLYDGFTGMTEAEFKSDGKLFSGIIDNITTGKGEVKIEAVDLFQKLEKVEVPPKVDIRLTADITASASSIVVQGFDTSELALASPGAGSNSWYGMCADSLGNVYASVYGADLYKMDVNTKYFYPLRQTARNWTGMVCDGNDDVYCATYGGDIYKSTSGGDFTALSQTTRNWTGMTIYGTNIYACEYGGDGDVYMRTAGAGAFVALGDAAAPSDWYGMAASSTGVYAVIESTDIYKQTAGTGNFAAITSGITPDMAIAVDASDNVYAGTTVMYMQAAEAGSFVQISSDIRTYRGMAVDDSGTVYASAVTGDIYRLVGGIGDFLPLSQTSLNYWGMAADKDDNIFVSVASGNIYKQTASAGTFASLGQSKAWTGLGEAPNGDVFGCVWNDGIYIKLYGSDTFNQVYASAVQWSGIAVDPVTSNIYATVYDGDMYVSTDWGVTWTACGLILTVGGETIPSFNGVHVDSSGVVWAACHNSVIRTYDTSRMPWTSGDYPVIWESSLVGHWADVCSTDNGDVYGVTYGAYIFKKTSRQADFVQLNDAARLWHGCTVNSNDVVYACDYGGDIYRQSDFISMYEPSIIIGSEIIYYNKYDSATETVSQLIRGRYDTLPAEHKDNDKIGLVKVYTEAQPHDRCRQILYDAGVVTGDIDETQIDTEKTFEPLANVATVITKPTKAMESYFQVIELFDFRSWVSEDQQITIGRALPNDPNRTTTTITDAANITEDSASVDENQDSLVTRCSIYWDKDPVEQGDDEQDFDRLTVIVDANSESTDGFDQIADKTIKTRWFRSDMDGADGGDITNDVESLGSRHVFWYRSPQPLLIMDLELQNNAVQTGAYVSVTTDEIQDTDGNDLTASVFHVVKRERMGNMIRIKGRSMSAGSAGGGGGATGTSKVLFIADDAAPDFTAATDAEKNTNGYICSDDEQMADGTAPYVIY